MAQQLLCKARVTILQVVQVVEISKHKFVAVVIIFLSYCF